jgi:RNA polymerase sigma-70 factor (ECF subfamily)
MPLTMASEPDSPTVRVPRDLVRRLHARAQAGRWALAEKDFQSALERSASSRFRGHTPSSRDIEQYLGSLHLEDLGLACACARGLREAWEYFVRECRPVLLRAASASAPPDVARELAISIYGDLFGLDERNGVRRSLFDYFHGRSSLGGWLRAVIAQRVVDRAREQRRTEPLPDENESPGSVPSVNPGPPDVDRPRHLALVRAALSSVLGALEPRDRLRLALYYTQELKLAAVGRLLGESEATSSRKLERTRRELRAGIEHRLREVNGLTEVQVAACFDYGRSDPEFDLARALPPDGLRD